MKDLADARARELLDRERSLLMDVQRLLERMRMGEALIGGVRDVVERLDALFLLVIVGEFNAGKSSVINALFGEKIMEEGPIPTTAKINLLRYGAEVVDRQVTEFIVERRRPHALLKSMDFVDTPGTNSIVKEHQTITEDFIPRSDLVLFVTSYDRPLTESERTFLEFIRSAWGKRLVFVLNKADLSGSPEEMQQVISHIKSGSEALMGLEPRVFPVSAKKAFAAKQAGDEALFGESQFDVLEEFITKTLAGPQQLALKLTAPLDTARQVLDQTSQQIERHRRVLDDDTAHLKAFDEHLTQKQAGIAHGYERYLAEVDNLLLEMERRGVQFLDDNIRIGKLQTLRDKDKFKEEFNRQVVRDHERQIEKRIDDAVDWLIQEVFGLWNWTHSHMREQLRVSAPENASPGSREFFYNRSEVLGNLMREANRKIESYDIKEEARRILENTNDTASLVLGAEAAAAGLGALAAVLMFTTAADTVGGVGLVSAGALAVFGLFLLPRQRRKAIDQFKEQVEGLRRDIRKALEDQFARELDGALAKVQDIVEPFRTFVVSEGARLAEAMADRGTISNNLQAIQA
ncbi:MAG: dynamin family protein, partial [Bacteroidota bacterium]